MTRFERLSPTTAILGEGPLWDPHSQTLMSLDCMGRKLFRHTPATGAEEVWALPRTPGSFAFRANGGVLMAYRRGLAMIEPGTDMLDDIATPGIDLGVAVFNDGKCDRRGRFWTGTMDREVKDPVGALYRLDPDLSVHRMDGGITLANGIAWSPDDRTMYFCDSRPGHVWAYDYDIASGQIENRRMFMDFAGRKGRPDGCTVDVEGCLWVAEISAGQVVRLDPAGREVAAVAVPVPRPTSVMFGGPDLRTLFVTSMRHGLSAEELQSHPASGCIWAGDVGIAGIEEPRFAG